MQQLASYDPEPRYAPVGMPVSSGWPAAVAELPPPPLVLACDGPAILDWETLAGGLARALAERGIRSSLVDMRACFAPWSEILRRTASAHLADDPVFAPLASGALADLIDTLPDGQRPHEGVGVIFGPGAALADHDVLWYVDLPKRYAEAIVTSGGGHNLGQRNGAGPASTRRLFYIDWPLLDRHRAAIATRIDRWFDARQLADQPASLDGMTLRRTLQWLADRPFRTLPTFNSTPWGGHWAQRELGFNRGAGNTALGYELIAPESGVLIGERGGPIVEVPFELIASLYPCELMGQRVHSVFGTSFPIRFDYLDTLDGGNLSVHCHPRSEYMRNLFGWPYTQHESYYVMLGAERNKVFLGLRDGVDVRLFRAQADNANRRGHAMDVERFVQTFHAEPHRLFLIPAGTPHASGAGNVVLEVSATPYLYSLRFYDWLRRDQQGNQRPVHVDHAFRNLDTGRAGSAVERELLQQPRILRQGPEWREELIGRLPEMFFDVRRVVVEPAGLAEANSSEGFHVLNLVDGDSVAIRTSAGYVHTLAYAETAVVPAAVGAYTLRNLGQRPARVVKALVR